MNIFLLNKDVELNAQAYVDSHIRKIPVEINQMLATALSLYSDNAVIHKVNGKPYTPCFHHHPCTKWVAQSRENFIYAIEVSLELHSEYFARWGDTIGTRTAVLEAINYIDLLPRSNDSDQLFPVAINQDNLKKVYTGGYLSNKEYMAIYNKQLVPLDIAIKAYRGYYITCKSHLATWTNVQKPEWYETL